jgi:DNA-binding response OmpR family regulator
MKKRVLVVDDSEAILEVIKITLEFAGYEVATSLTGECFQQMENDLPDLILLDVSLAGEDGREMCRHLKDNETSRHIPVILISARDSMWKRVDGFGANDFLAKPFHITDLRDTVKKYLLLSSSEAHVC